LIEVTASVAHESVDRRLNNAAEAIRDRIRKALGRIGEDIASTARLTAPSRSGALRSSIAPIYVETVEQQKEVVKAGEFYAVFLEHGTVMHGGAHNKNTGKGKRGRLAHLHLRRANALWRIQPHPFLSPVIDAMRDQIEARIAEAIGDAIADGEG
jgi:hypothetical protein